MRRHGHRLVVLVTTLACLTLWLGTPRAASLKEGNQLYAKGQWKAAAAAYQRIADTGLLHEDLYYNLGNAHFRAGQLGRAIFDYEQALRIAADDDTAYNLNLARDVVAARSRNQLRDAERSPWWQRLSLSVSISNSTLSLLILNALLFSILIGRRYFPPGFRRSILVVLAACCGIGATASALTLAGHVYIRQEIHHGIVIKDAVTMHEGPDASLEERGQLHPGLQITVITKEPRWLLIRLSNGVEGWVPASAVELFR